jgi:hypothetical protein
MKIVATLFFAIFFISGCVQPFDSDRYKAALNAVQPVGTMTILKQPTGLSNWCTLRLTFTNLHEKLPVEPRLRMIFYDRTGNTLGSISAYFDPILAQKQQTKDSLINTGCSSIARGYLSESSALSGTKTWKIRDLPVGTTWKFE